MRISTVHIARSIWLFPTVYLNPTGRSIIPVIRGIIDRYSFLEHTPLADVEHGKSLELKAGTFNTQDDIAIGVSLAVHSDGLVVNTRSSTEDSDDFLEDALFFLFENFGLASYIELPINKKYLSEIYFTLNNVPVFISKLTESFMKKTSSYVHTDKVGEFQFMGFHLATDPKISSSPPFIRVEREIGIPFEEKRFFSSGSIKTRDHINLLEALEAEVSQ